MFSKDIALSQETFTTMTVRDFIYKTKTPLIQRDHESRVMGGKVDYFNKVLINHKVVFIARYVGEKTKLIDNDTMEYGDLFVMDGNTRKHFWRMALEKIGHQWEKFADTLLMVGYREVKTFEELNLWYDTFDSKGQLKTPKDNARSAANILGLEDYMVKNMSTAVSKVIRITKPSGITEVDFVTKKLEMFGVDIIQEFYETFEESISAKVKNKVSPFLVAYRALKEKFSDHSYNIDRIFHEMFTGIYKIPINSSGDYCVGMELHDMFLKDGVYSYLNPKSSGDRIAIISGVVYTLVKNAVTKDKYYVNRKHKPFAQSTSGAQRAMEIFYQEIAEKIV